MKIEKINTPAAGAWARDCELICLADSRGFRIGYHKDEDNTYWSLQCEHIIAYQVIGEKFSTRGYLMHLPAEGALVPLLSRKSLRVFQESSNVNSKPWITPASW